MTTTFESLSCELIMFIIEFIDNPLSLFLNLNSNLNRILSNHQIKLNCKIEGNIHHTFSLPTNLTRLVLMNSKSEDLRRFQNLKSLILSIDENMVRKMKFPLSLVSLRMHFNGDIPSSLYHSLSVLKQLQTLILSSRKQTEIPFHVDSTVFSRNMKILQLKNISMKVSSICNYEELTELKYLNLQLSGADGPFHPTMFTFSSFLKTLIIQFQFSFTELEYVLSGCCEENLKHLELYSQIDTTQLDYFDGKRWLKLFGRFPKLTICQIQLQQKGRGGVYNNIIREFKNELETNKELKEKWNMRCYSARPGYHGTTTFVQIVANL